MGEVKHTPGPWSWEEEDEFGFVSLSPGIMLFSSVRDGTPYGDEHDRANARLIAAAPDLLEALHNALTAGLPEEVAVAARAAIAKAESTNA